MLILCQKSSAMYNIHDYFCRYLSEPNTRCFSLKKLVVEKPKKLTVMFQLFNDQYVWGMLEV